MNINHRPIFDTKTVEEFYTKKDGVPVKYVCTSALGDEDFAGDIFYRDTPHPEFGNRYFQLFFNGYGGSKLDSYSIRSADKVEELEFTMLDTIYGYHYSQHRHDFLTVGAVSIDGGRAYTRTLGFAVKTKIFKLKNGEFVNV